MNEKLNVHIRGMIRRDMPQVMAVENASYPQPWTEQDFLRVLRQPNRIGIVAEKDEKVIGYMIYELHKTYFNLINFAVHPSCRRKRVGTQLISKMQDKLSSHRRVRILLLIGERNLEGQQFFAFNGFLATASYPGYFGEAPDEEDAYEMEYALVQSEQDKEKEWAELLAGHYNPTNRIQQYLEHDLGYEE